METTQVNFSSESRNALSKSSSVPPLSFKPIAMRNKWRFVVKKHRATRLHYDFRLEFPGILKSWVIEIEGPSMKANEVREVRMVGDHNPQYIYREGIIPEGQYGAGEMIVYDRGVYFPKFGGNSKTLDKEVLAAMFKLGEIDFFMMGHKLKGKFKLVKTYNDDKSWHLIKLDDIHCTMEDITKLDRSVITGKTIMDIKNSRSSNTIPEPDMFSI